MKKSLTKTKRQDIYYYKNDTKIIINRNARSTYPSELRGNISSELSGDISGLSGDISSELRGNISGLSGNCTNIEGNLDDCELTDEDREKRVDIKDLTEN